MITYNFEAHGGDRSYVDYARAERVKIQATLAKASLIEISGWIFQLLATRHNLQAADRAHQAEIARLHTVIDDLRGRSRWDSQLS